MRSIGRHLQTQLYKQQFNRVNKIYTRVELIPACETEDTHQYNLLLEYAGVLKI